MCPERETLRFIVSNSARKLSWDFSRRAKPTTFSVDGNSPSAARLYNAGMSFLLVKSPEAPKMTTVQGSGRCRVTSSSRNGLMRASKVEIRWGVTGPEYDREQRIDSFPPRNQGNDGRLAMRNFDGLDEWDRLSIIPNSNAPLTEPSPPGPDKTVSRSRGF